MMTLILLLIIGVAAFNLISMLVMTVNEKKYTVAILRTMGASKNSIVSIFYLGYWFRYHWSGNGSYFRDDRCF